MNSIESLDFVFPLRADKTQEWRAWIREILGPRRSEYEAFSRKLGLKTQRAYLQLQTSQDPFAVWGRQRIQDLFDGVDLTQTDLGSLSQFVFDGPSADEDEAHSHARKVIALIVLVALDAFETIVLPRRVTRRIRLTRLFYRVFQF